MSKKRRAKSRERAIYVAIIAAVAAFGGTLWGWCRHELELAGLHIVGVVLCAQEHMAREKLRDEVEQMKLP